MRVERTIDLDSRVVILTVSGDLDDGELLRLGEELAGTSGLKQELSLLIDLRQANGKSVTSTGVQRLVVQPLVLSAASRRAVVVPSNFGFGMARMYEMLREDRGGSPRVFRDYADARRWVTSAGS